MIEIVNRYEAFSDFTKGKSSNLDNSIQVILPNEQIHQIQKMIADLIKQEIENRLNNSNLKSPFLNKQQACKYLGISNNTLDSWIQKGLPTIRIGKTIRFDKTEINRWLKKY